MKVVMLGADRSVKGGVSAVVNNLYEAGLDQRIDLTYIGTMVDGSTAAKLLKGVQALLKFVTVLPKADIVHLNMAADASCYRKLIFMQIALWFHKKVVIHEHGGDFQGFYYKRCSAKRQAYIKKMLNPRVPAGKVMFFHQERKVERHDQYDISGKPVEKH